MEGVQPSFMDDDVNQLDLQAQEDNFNMSELLSSPAEEVPVNQSSMLCNDQAGQNMLVNINDTTQQTTRFPPSFPQTMMEGAPPSSGEDDVNLTWNRLELEKLLSLPSSPLEEVPVNQSSILCNDQGGQNMLVDSNDSTQQTTQFPPHNHQVSGDHDPLNSNCYDSTFFEPTSSSRSPPEEVPVNQSSISCNDQAGQNLLVNINDSFHQTTRFPTSFPQTMMEGAPPSSVEDDVNSTSNQLDFETFNMSELLLLPPEAVPVNQSSMLCNDQVGQNMLVDNNDSIQQTTQFPPSFPQTMTTMGGLDGTSSSWINHNGPNWPQTASSDQRWTNQVAMSNQVPGMLPQPPMNQCSRQFPYQVPITPNLYDPQCSTMSPQFPHNLQVSGDHNQGQNENHSSGPDSSLQSRNRGLNTQQVRSLTELSPTANCLL